MNAVKLSFEGYIERLNAGATNSSASYEIEGDAHLKNVHALTLKGLTFLGSV